jgi:hypothetical protein
MRTTTATTTAPAHSRAARLALGLVAALTLSAAAPSLDTHASDTGALERAAAAIAVSDAHAGRRNNEPLP